MNQRPRIVDQGSSAAAHEWITTEEATRLLDVKRETLYERLRARSQARAGHGPVAASALRWGDPVLETRIGSIGPAGPVYRGRAAALLAREGASFEDVCALAMVA